MAYDCGMSAALTVNRKTADRLEWLAARHKRAVANAKQQQGVYVAAAVATATGIGLGYLKGKYDREDVQGIPIAPIVGVAGHVLAYYANDNEATLLHAAADAALAVGAFAFGKRQGEESKAGAQQTA